MKKITVSDLLSIDEYNAQRPAIRQAMMEHKKTRRLHLGENVAIHFEDYMVMRYQMLELIRAEKISGADDLAEELDAYNPLIPDGKNLKATFMIEYPDEAERKQRLSQLVGIEEQVSIQIDGCEPVYPICNEDLERSTEDKTSAVHFMRFEFSDDMIAAAKAGAKWTVRCEHVNYQEVADPVPEAIRASLLRDFD